MRSIISIAVAAIGLAGDFDLMGIRGTPTRTGKISAEEFAAFQEQGWGFFSQGAESVKVADLQPMAKPSFDGIAPDANGAITHAAYTRRGAGPVQGRRQEWRRIAEQGRARSHVPAAAGAALSAAGSRNRPVLFADGAGSS